MERYTVVFNEQLKLIEAYRIAMGEHRIAAYNYELFNLQHRPSEFASTIVSMLQLELQSTMSRCDNLATRIMLEAYVAITDEIGNDRGSRDRDLLWRMVETYASEGLPSNGAVIGEIYVETEDSYRLIWHGSIMREDIPPSIFSNDGSPYLFVIRDGFMIGYTEASEGLRHIPTHLRTAPPSANEGDRLLPHDLLAYMGE